MTMLLFGIVGLLFGIYFFQKNKTLNKYVVIGGSTLGGLFIGKIVGAILGTILTYFLIGGTIALFGYLLFLQFHKKG